MGPGRSIVEFGSEAAQHLSSIRFDGRGSVTFLRLGTRGHLGRHRTVLNQVYYVVEGSGWVAGANGEQVSIAAGQAAVWDPGEEHESGTDIGMTVVVLEAPTVEAA